ncbi:RagB/SusD domain protein [Pseudopedobacter saltans DSM 12145]|uniref:RagB/SusD domain protein n=1 Tax=Pseudopedobacter saltans (strain ATCC 51119 / DSM 12145 / JCM 21818 / CCUG 39354 / LMG 10337 / NBRC 100064 / NCIMB 13643) TaxID=762903 RepID=F0S664_PSESL|nr:RagB/SusD family nutrient uptake outer membrane protein [Pseudopedobacter saltans]ADY53178.1 RagB/SusD domain protein [Pseudopedobacter saltans DSM 12145]
MKFQYIKLSMLTLVLSLGACNKKIDLYPIASDTEANFYRDQKDCFQGLAAAYNVLLWDAPQNQNAPFQLISEVLGDKCFTGGASATDLPALLRVDRGIIRTDDLTPKAMWYKYYYGIYRTNILLEKLPAATFDEPELRERYAAEAKFLRAYYYFDLVRLFGNVPLILKTLAPSEYNQKQATPEEVYKQIGDDLLAAINVLPHYKDLPADQYGRVTSDAAGALLMRVWLYYTGYYKKAEMPNVSSTQILDISEKVINQSGHDLLPKFSDVFVNDAPFNHNNKESVFEIQYSSKANSGNFSYREEANGNLAVMLWAPRDPNSASIFSAGWSFAPIDAEFYNSFPNDDLRKDATFLLPKNISVSFTPGYQNTDIFPKKWMALKANQATRGDFRLNFPNHFIAIRFSDVLLMASELNLLHGGSAAKAQTYFEKVAKRAHQAGYVAPTVTLDVLYRERELELALEGVRYWDLMRRGLDYAKSKIDINRGEPFISKFNMDAEGLFPIPQEEIINAKYTLSQNKGYF